jgi:hypothetical protein
VGSFYLLKSQKNHETGEKTIKSTRQKLGKAALQTVAACGTIGKIHPLQGICKEKVKLVFSELFAI